jgi:hypothetical protein
MAIDTTLELRPPFPLPKLRMSPWREQAQARIAEQRFVLSCIRDAAGSRPIPAEAEATIEGHWRAAAAGAQGAWRPFAAAVARVDSHLDAVDTSLLRIAPPSYVFGQLPGVLARVRRHLPEDDVRRVRVEHLAGASRTDDDLSETDRDLVVAAEHAASAGTRAEVARLRSFKNLLYGAAAVLAVVAIALGLFARAEPSALPLCFNPDGHVVCPTSAHAIGGAAGDGGTAGAVPQARVDQAMREHAGRWDIPLVMGIGLLAAALAAATSLRNIRGTSTPYRLPVALAVLKLPTGALTAVVGLILMRGEFVPGLSALDTSGQIISWAVLLGYSQQLLTRFVDQRGQTVLDNFGRTASEKAEANRRPDAAVATA